MKVLVKPPECMTGQIYPPGDKSISHRAAIIGSLAEGTTVINGFLTGADCLNTLKCLRALGVSITGPDKGRVIIKGNGLYSLNEPETVLDAGNSGTTMRLLLGVLAGNNFFCVINGDSSLNRRPMGRVTGPLRLMGARINGRKNAEFAPLCVSGGNLKPIDYTLPVASAQVKSAILLAGLFTEGETIVNEPYKSRDHTERMLEAAGASIWTEEKTVCLKGNKSLKPLEVDVPGDISSAAFFLIAACIHRQANIKLLNVNLNHTRTGVIDILREMGANIEIKIKGRSSGEEYGDISVSCSRLRGVNICGEIIPRLIDEIPVLAVAASCAGGKTVIKDASELKVKESNRIILIARELSKMGVNITPTDDGLIILGGKKLTGAIVDSYGDHRIGMALAVAALAADSPTVICGAECVSISYPGFFKDIKKLGVEVRELDC